MNVTETIDHPVTVTVLGLGIVGGVVLILFLIATIHQHCCRVGPDPDYMQGIGAISELKNDISL